MNKPHWIKSKRIAIISLVLTGTMGSAQAGDYSNIYFFGDSITDSGTFESIVGAKARFTTKPGLVWSENLGANYGKSVSPVFSVKATNPANMLFPSNTYGNNFAVGDAQINSPPQGVPAATNLPSVKMQVEQFLTRGTVDSKALYALWAGGNDIFAQFGQLPGISMPVAQAGIDTVASDMTAQVVRLQAAGARKLIVIGAMDMTKSPCGLAMPAADLAGKNLIYFDMIRLSNQILANPLVYATAELSKAMRLGVGVSTTISQPDARNSAINVTLSAPL